MPLNDIWEEWVIDITMTSPNGMLCFIPYNAIEDSFITGMNYISNKCPGKLIGVVHADGQAEVEKWVKENPDWYNKYSKEEDNGKDN